MIKSYLRSTFRYVLYTAHGGLEANLTRRLDPARSIMPERQANAFICCADQENGPTDKKVFGSLSMPNPTFSACFSRKEKREIFTVQWELSAQSAERVNQLIHTK